MFNFKKLLITLLIVGLITEQVTSHLLLMKAAHIKKKIILKKIHLIRPIVRHLAAKKLIAGKLLLAKAAIAGKIGLGAVAIKHLTTGLRTAAAPVARTAATPAPAQRTLPVFRSSLSFPEINVPVRFSVGGAGPAIRSDVRSEVSKTSTRQAAKV